MKYILVSILTFLAPFLCAEIHELIPPHTEDGEPFPGRKTRVYLSDKIYYTLYLPANFHTHKLWPVIFESPSNPCEEFSGLPDDTYLGYGLSKGQDYIWVCAPYLNLTGKEMSAGGWGGDGRTTVNCWLKVLNHLNSILPIDNERILLCGFSRGAIGCNFIGNWNDTIASKWSSYFIDDCFDCEQFGLGFAARLNRLLEKNVLLAVGEFSHTKEWTLSAYDILQRTHCNLYFLEIPDEIHSPKWTLTNSVYANMARDWLRSI